jgi:hypothetical protein
LDFAGSIHAADHNTRQDSATIEVAVDEPASALSATQWVNPYNIVWNSPSLDSLDSMPLSGRLGAGANVWVQDSSLWLYVAHNGAYDENGRLLKLGCVRLTPEDKSLTDSTTFQQQLDLANGTIRIRSGDFAASLWFAGQTLMIEATSVSQQSLQVDFATWRDQKRSGLKLDVWGSETVQSDKVATDETGIVWWHRNADYPSDVAGAALQQGISKEGWLNPTERLVFGGAIAAAGGLTPTGDTAVHWQSWDGRAWTARTVKSDRHLLVIALRAKRDGDPAVWLREAAAATILTTKVAAKKDEATRWAEFWARSYIVVNPNAKPDDAGWQVGRNYQLFRYMLACNRDGELPLLFNGGIFSTDDPPGRIADNNNPDVPISPGSPSTPDFRRWLGCHFMSQNQRWVGWPTLAAGDADLLAPSVAFYRNRSRVAAARAGNLGADGVVYPEPLDVWGLCCVEPLANGLCGAEHLTYDFDMMLQFAWMTLQAHSVLGTRLHADIPWIEGTVRFYDTFYRAQCKKRTGKELDADGKLVLYPCNGLELARGATNPVETIAGLQRTVDGLLALPADLVPMTSRDYLQRVQGRLPDLPIGERDGKRSLLVAKSWEEEMNKWELPELYAAWPYRLVGVTQPKTLQLARNTWNTIPDDRARLCKQDMSWMPTIVDMAALGWPAEAKQRVVDKLSDRKAQVRFPAFFGPGHDWLPDHNWGGSGMVGLQEMLVAAQPEINGKIMLLPAWPMEWDVDFKLHTSEQTIVECSYRRGEIRKLTVTPPSRAADVLNLLDKSPPDESTPAR